MLQQVTLRLFLTFQSALDAARDEDGQTIAEYGMIISVIAVATILTATVLFKSAIVGAFNKATTCLSGTC